MSLNKKQLTRLNRIIKLNENNPDKYCWPDLHDMAITENREERLEYKESAQSMWVCKTDLKNHGSCWCGKFKSE